MTIDDEMTTRTTVDDCWTGSDEFCRDCPIFGGVCVADPPCDGAQEQEIREEWDAGKTCGCAWNGPAEAERLNRGGAR